MSARHEGEMGEGEGERAIEVEEREREIQIITTNNLKLLSILRFNVFLKINFNVKFLNDLIN